MEELANRHWDGTGPDSRITWVKSIVKRYFLDDDRKRIVRRAKRRARAAEERPSDEAEWTGDVESDVCPLTRDGVLVTKFHVRTDDIKIRYREIVGNLT